MRCPQCGSDNPPEYRFCGMCGTTLAKKEAPVAEPVSVRHETAHEKLDTNRRPEPSDSTLRINRVERVEQERRSEPVSSSLSGPSFLGLGSESAHGNGRSDSDVSYLFDEEEMRPRRTYWRFTVLLLIVALIGGLVYLQYRKEGKSWVAPWSNGPAQTPVQSSQADQQNQQAQSQANTPANPVQNNSAPNNAPPAAEDQAGNQANTAPPAQNNQPAAKDNGSAKDQSTNSDQGETKKNNETETAKAETPSTDEESADTEAAPPPTPTRATKPKPARPSAPLASPDDQLVANAEKYLYGRGVPQNCDRALSSLRSAAGRENTRARTLLGTMYATGHCVPKDLPNAYRWFAQASRTSPDNMWVQRNLEMVWREMTAQERQLATKSQ